jgi:hypothetical protein
MSQSLKAQTTASSNTSQTSQLGNSLIRKTPLLLQFPWLTGLPLSEEPTFSTGIQLALKDSPYPLLVKTLMVKKSFIAFIFSTNIYLAIC